MRPLPTEPRRHGAGGRSECSSSAATRRRGRRFQAEGQRFRERRGESAARGRARWLQEAKKSGASTQARSFIGKLMDTEWPRGSLPRIASYLEEPKTLQELEGDVSSPRAGFEVHHRAERTSALTDGYPRSVVNGRGNLVLIPTLRHWEVTGWYMKSNKDFGGLTPREYLRGKSWEERQRIGNQAMKLHGILKP